VRGRQACRCIPCAAYCMQGVPSGVRGRHPMHTASRARLPMRGTGTHVDAYGKHDTPPGQARIYFCPLPCMKLGEARHGHAWVAGMRNRRKGVPVVQQGSLREAMLLDETGRGTRGLQHAHVWTQGLGGHGNATHDRLVAVDAPPAWSTARRSRSDE